MYAMFTKRSASLLFPLLLVPMPPHEKKNPQDVGFIVEDVSQVAFECGVGIN